MRIAETAAIPPKRRPAQPHLSSHLGGAQDTLEKMAAKGEQRRLIVVSNRLPVTIKRSDQGEYEFKMSSGGLVSALSGCKRSMDFQWFGWPGIDIPVEEREMVSKRLQDEFSCFPVYISDELADRHYNGFSNSILWPLFHYHPAEIVFDEVNWMAYREANLWFAEAVRKEIQKGDLVWVQDYHLMLLPKMLRALLEGKDPSAGLASPEDPPRLFRARTKTRTFSDAGSRTRSRGRQSSSSDTHSAVYSPSLDRSSVNEERSSVTIGFFLHTPFPSSEIYRCVVRNNFPPTPPASCPSAARSCSASSTVI